MPRTTIKGIAQQLGISTASVSYALNGLPGVSAATRARVRALAEEQDWMPSASARALSTARAGAVGMVLNRRPELLGNEPYYMHVLQGIEEVLAAADMSLLLRMTGGPAANDVEIYRRWNAEGKVDGVILFDLAVDDPRPRALDNLELPYVLHGVQPGRTSRLEEQERDAATIIAHLAELGHREILHLTGPSTFLHEVDRRRAVVAAAREAGMTVRAAKGDYTADGAASVVGSALAEGMRQTAVIASNDLMALGVLDAIHDAKRLDIALVSWDDSMVCRLARPSVTALGRHPEEHGRRSARVLLGMLSGHEPVIDDIPPAEMRVRATSVRSYGD